MQGVSNQETPNEPSSFGREFWESEKTRPEWTKAKNTQAEYFQNEGNRYLKECMEHPYLAQSQVKRVAI